MLFKEFAVPRSVLTEWARKYAGNDRLVDAQLVIEPDFFINLILDVWEMWALSAQEME
jgi:hypothetical protein